METASKFVAEFNRLPTDYARSANGDSPFGLLLCAVAMVGWIFGLPWLIYYLVR